MCRGVTRFFARNGVFLAPEVSLPNGRRADLMGIDEKGYLIIVEVKVSKADFLGDMKWPEYLDYCDRFYWAVPSDFDRSLTDREAALPSRTGVVVADGFDAAIARPAGLQALSAPRRKAETMRLARLALRRLAMASDDMLSSDLIGDNIR
jgi:hypothetical protein